MYSSKIPLPYIFGHYAIMPPGLPDRFYPEKDEDKYFTEHYVICFMGNVSKELKERFIKEYAEYFKKRREDGIYLK